MPNITRRTFLKRLAWSSAIVGVGGAVYPTLIEPRFVHVRRVPVVIQGLPTALDGLTIAHLTDLHRSRVVSSEYLAECIATANALAPDLMVFTGDYLTVGEHLSHHHPRIARWIQILFKETAPTAEMVRDCARCMSQSHAKYGVFASLGNHDNWYDGNAAAQVIESVGIPVLRNASQTIRVNGEPLAIVGLGDLWTDGVDIWGAFQNVDTPFSLVLMHNPDSFEDWPRQGSHLILAGHTHGGQVVIPFYGPPQVPSQYGQKYAHGLFARGDTHMHVSRGVGLIAPPVRFNCPPEIVLLRLQKA
ncbi:MAG: metallophosphoesterase [Verrucomicrobiia bacterium]